jgi:hypothetical protein
MSAKKSTELPVTPPKSRARLGVDDMLQRLEGAITKLGAAKKLVGSTGRSVIQERLIDTILTLVAEEVIDQTRAGGNLEARTSAVKLLLKRADQRLIGRRLQILKMQVKKGATTSVPGSGLPAGEREQAVNEILGIS